jgi:hypothetical protein
MSWKEEGKKAVPSGHTMSLNEALHVATHNFIIKLLIPDWALGLTARFRNVKVGFDEMRVRLAKKVPWCLFFSEEKIACVDVYRGNDARAWICGWKVGAEWSVEQLFGSKRS